MIKDLVSIITPCYNGEKYLDRYFNSIIAQTYRPLELIFVNDGSTDKTEDIVKKYESVLEKEGIKLIYIYQENAGQAAALNKGLKLFTGKYLMWPDSDDVMTQDSVEKHVDFLTEHPSYDMVRSNGIYYNELEGSKIRISNADNNYNEDIFEDILLVRTYGCCGCYMITKKIYEDIYADKDIYISRVGQNWQLLVPVSSRTKCGYIDEDLYVVYEHDDSHSRNKNINHIERCDGFLKILLEAIELSSCNKEESIRLVKEKCARDQFYYAISEGNKKLIKKKASEIRKFGTLTFNEKLLYLKHVYLKSR